MLRGVVISELQACQSSLDLRLPRDLISHELCVVSPEYRIPNEDPGGKGFHGHDRERSLFLPDAGEQRQALGHRGVFKMAKHHLRLDAECGFGISTRSWVTPPLSRYALSFSLWNSASLRMTEQVGAFFLPFRKRYARSRSPSVAQNTLPGRGQGTRILQHFGATSTRNCRDHYEGGPSRCQTRLLC